MEKGSSFAAAIREFIEVEYGRLGLTKVRKKVKKDLREIKK